MMEDVTEGEGSKNKGIKKKLLRQKAARNEAIPSGFRIKKQGSKKIT